MRDAGAGGLVYSFERADQLPPNSHYVMTPGSVSIEEFRGATVWEGIVHVFDLANNPAAIRAYAWSSPIEGSDKRRFFAVLHIPPIDSPVAAVRAAIVAERRAMK